MELIGSELWWESFVGEVPRKSFVLVVVGNLVGIQWISWISFTTTSSFNQQLGNYGASTRASTKSFRLHNIINTQYDSIDFIPENTIFSSMEI